MRDTITNNCSTKSSDEVQLVTTWC